MTTEPQTLSSAQTFVMKCVFPIVWIAGFAAATLSLFLAPNSWTTPDGQPPGPGVKAVALVVTLVGTGFIYWWCVRLKRVRMDSGFLYVSNYSIEIVVPLANVVEVTENRWVNSHPVTIRFHSNTDFGSEVTFMPKLRWFAFWSSHPVVEKMRLAVKRATGQKRA